MIRTSLSIFLLMTLLCGFAYPSAVTGLANILFPKQSQGSLIEKDGQVLGSHLIGQNFTDAKYFWSRPSATRPYPYNASSSGASNLSPANPALLAAVKERRARFDKDAAIPADLLASSGSGLDPHISPAAAHSQIDRVAKARGLGVGEIETRVAQFTENRQLGFLGEPRVNILLLNLSLDGLLNE